MPIRMLRDWTDSDKVNCLSVHAERFFTRLIMKVDDYGCFYADTRLLKANLFPLLLDNIREADLLRWTTECQKAGLIVLYEVNSKNYLQIIDFKQRLDKARAKYPLPNDSMEVVNDFPAETERKPKPKPKPKGEEHPLTNSNLFRSPKIPGKEEVHRVFLSNGGSEEMAEKFFKKYDSVGWYLHGSPITNFSSLVFTFIENWNKNLKKDGISKVVKNKSAGAEKLLERLRSASA